MAAVVSGQQMHVKVCDNPVDLAIVELRQCVVSRGAPSGVLAITLGTAPSLTVRGTPGHGSPRRTSKCARRRRVRHMPTVRAVTRECRPAIAWKRSCGRAGTMRARGGNAREVSLHQFE
jgi:hypothetical protein